MSLAGTCAVRAVVSPKFTVGFVVRLAPFHRTTEPWSKVVPLTVSVNAAPPAVALEGKSPVITGTGACTLNENVGDGAGPGLMTCAVQLDGSLPNLIPLT